MRECIQFRIELAGGSAFGIYTMSFMFISISYCTQDVAVLDACMHWMCEMIDCNFQIHFVYVLFSVILSICFRIVTIQRIQIQIIISHVCVCI